MLYTWAEADEICRMEGGLLISIDTKDKHGYVAWVLDEDGESSTSEHQRQISHRFVVIQKC